jgi:molybdopterin-dependent oxidoreductase alpha subunit
MKNPPAGAPRDRKPSAFGGFDPRRWAGLAPYGIGQQKPDHFGEMFRTLWQNRRALPYAWRILTRGVCDGCALGTSGLSDWTMSGVHLCTVRLNLLHLNTMDALDPARLADLSTLAGRTSRELRALGRLAHPMVRRRGEKGFTRVSWNEALDLAAARLAPVLARDPDRFACYVTSRGITNEVYYALQKAVRFLGTNNVDNSARLCHAPSTTVLKSMLGATGSTCSYVDWIGADLIVLVGTDLANNQPVATKYLYYAKQRGTRIAVVNPFVEPGLVRYWIPSVAESALFGTKLMDEYFALDRGGDAAFFMGALKALLASRAGVDRAWIAGHTEGFAAVEAQAEAVSWETLEALSGAPRAEMERFAALYGSAGSVIFVWSMGVTQHAGGASNVRALVNLALARGMVGRDHTGLMPIRGHSGVQGGSEVGCVPNGLPGARPLDAAGRAAMEALWGFAPPERPGLDARAMVDAAHEGRIDAFYVVGGNFLETLPDPAYVEGALARVSLRIHQDIVLTNQMLVEPADVVLLFPARTRYEQEGGGTETTTERRIVFSPEIPGPRPGEARNEWEPLLEIARRIHPERAQQVACAGSADLRGEIARAVPFYRGIETLAAQGDQVQYGGRHLCAGGQFERPGGRARFEAPALDRPARGVGFQLTTRRGKQFNSMVHADQDPLTGARRKDILISPEDLARLGLEDGAAIVVSSGSGSFVGRARSAALSAGNVQGFWPEVNVLLVQGPHDAESGVPDYGATVTIARAPGAPTTEEP